MLGVGYLCVELFVWVGDFVLCGDEFEFVMVCVVGGFNDCVYGCECVFECGVY